MRRWNSLLVLFAACLGGCIVGPDYKPPTPPEGAKAPLVSVTQAAELTAEAPDSWWRLYNDPILDRLLDQAFAANADLKVAEANLSAARAIFEGARSGLYPSTKIEAGAVYGRDPTFEEILELEGQKPVSTWLFDSVFDVSYEIDLFGRVRRSIEAAKANAEASNAARDSLKITVAAETARAYAQICTLGEQLAIANHSLALVSHEEEITTQRHLAGANSDFDVVRAQGLTAQVRATLPPLEGQRRAALFELSALLGRTPVNAPSEVESCVTPPHLTSLIPVGDGGSLLRRRPDIRQADRILAVELAQIGVATADLYPRVSLSGFYGAATTGIDQIPTESALVWGVGPSMSWTFPNIAAPLARIHQAKSNADAALSHFDSVVLQALKETEQALSAYGSELQHHAALLDVQVKARRGFELAHNQFVAGALSNLDLLTSEEGLVSADNLVAVSDAAIVQDQIAVFKALGGGWGAREQPPGSGSAQPSARS